MAAAVHALSGAPSRGTELASLTIANSSYAVRNLYVIDGTLYLFFRYLKPRSITGMDASIPKALPKRLSRLIIQYTLLVVPVLALLTRERLGTESIALRATRDYETFLFVKNCVKMSGEDCRIAFEKYTLEWFGLTLNVSVFRQLVKAIFKYHLKYERRALGFDTGGPTYEERGRYGGDDDDDDDNSDPLYAQFGHSAAVSNTHYAVDADAISPSVSLDRLTEHTFFSRLWHSFMGLDVDARVAVPRDDREASVTRLDDNAVVSLAGVCNVSL